MSKRRQGVDWSTATFDQFLLRIAYVGTHYFGLAWQTARASQSFFDQKESGEPPKKQRRRAIVVPNPNKGADLPDWIPNPTDTSQATTTDSGLSVPTVEGVLFDSLLRANLVKSREECNFSRCGRTDRGVHARSNYVCLRLRLAKDGGDYDYVRILNSMLPRTVRVLACGRVPLWFDARFHCSLRHYKYYFSTDGLDISEMRLGAASFMGEHDFRNFCKIDPDSQRTFRRRVLQFDIHTLGDGLAVATVVGPAFLWHQVRCMMGALYLVGQHIRPSVIIKDWLDIERTPYKPSYTMAGPEGLILWDCAFEGVQLLNSDERAVEGLNEMRRELAVHQAVLSCLTTGIRQPSVNDLL